MTGFTFEFWRDSLLKVFITEGIHLKVFITEGIHLKVLKSLSEGIPFEGICLKDSCQNF